MTDNTSANDWLRGRSGKQTQQPAMADADVSRLAVELLTAAKGDPEKTARVEADLARLAPHMFGRAQASGSADGGSGGEGPQTSAGVVMNDFIRESARR